MPYPAPTLKTETIQDATYVVSPDGPRLLEPQALVASLYEARTANTAAAQRDALGRVIVRTIFGQRNAALPLQPTDEFETRGKWPAGLRARFRYNPNAAPVLAEVSIGEAGYTSTLKYPDHEAADAITLFGECAIKAGPSNSGEVIPLNDPNAVLDPAVLELSSQVVGSLVEYLGGQYPGIHQQLAELAARA